tara:strand:+ start:311 stop:988 length:678 start_codon:yes stop_codon:yes gene_type:complete
MSKVKIDTMAGLESFLKILAEESVRKAHADVAIIEEDKEQSYFEKQMKKDKMRFKSANVSERDEAVDDTADAEEEEEVEARNAPEVAKPEEEKDIEVEEQKKEINYYMIRDALNTIRSGRSLKDKDTKGELESYVGRLSKEERGVLFTFLNSISDIMTDMVAGDDAQDPSEPPSSFTVKKKEEIKVSEKPKQSKRPKGEDTTPPIRVGMQQTEAIRRKVKELMSF